MAIVRCTAIAVTAKARQLYHRWSSRWKFFPRGWYARSLLPSWGRRFVLIIPGGGISYTLGWRPPPPTLTRSRGLPFGTWGLLIVRYFCITIIKMKDFRESKGICRPGGFGVKLFALVMFYPAKYYVFSFMKGIALCASKI